MGTALTARIALNRRSFLIYTIIASWLYLLYRVSAHLLDDNPALNWSNPCTTLLLRILPPSTMTTPAAPPKPEKRIRHDRQFRIMFRPTGPFSSATPVAAPIPDAPPRRKISRILGITSTPTTLVDDLCTKLVEVLTSMVPRSRRPIADVIEIFTLGPRRFEGTFGVTRG